MDKLIDKIFVKGSQLGFEEQELYISSNKKLSIAIYKQEIDKYSLSEDGGVSYRGILNGKMGYSFTECLDEESIDVLVREAYSNAEIIDNNDEVLIHRAGDVYEDVKLYNSELSEVIVNEKIELLMEIERKILAGDTRIAQVMSTVYEEAETHRRIINTRGLDVEERSNYCLAYSMASATENQETRTGFAYRIGNSFDCLCVDEIVEEAIEDTISMLGAKPIPSASMPVVFKNEVFAQIQSAFSGIFSAENVQKGLSKLKGRLNEKIAFEGLTIIDDPLLIGGMSSEAFDAEGVATKKKLIVDNGILKTYLHNLKTAKKDGCESTGNASKASYKGTVGISPSNIYIKPSSIEFDEIIRNIENGIYITDVQGLHAGLNSISGDFSIQCQGFMIENGQLNNPITQITVAGNYFEMILNVEIIGDDLKFTILGDVYAGSPSVKVKGLTISGE